MLTDDLHLLLEDSARAVSGENEKGAYRAESGVEIFVQTSSCGMLLSEFQGLDDCLLRSLVFKIKRMMPGKAVSTSHSRSSDRLTRNLPKKLDELLKHSLSKSLGYVFLFLL